MVRTPPPAAAAGPGGPGPRPARRWLRPARWRPARPARGCGPWPPPGPRCRARRRRPWRTSGLGSPPAPPPAGSHRGAGCRRRQCRRPPGSGGRWRRGPPPPTGRTAHRQHVVLGHEEAVEGQADRGGGVHRGQGQRRGRSQRGPAAVDEGEDDLVVHAGGHRIEAGQPPRRHPRRLAVDPVPAGDRRGDDCRRAGSAPAARRPPGGRRRPDGYSASRMRGRMQ